MMVLWHGTDAIDKYNYTKTIKNIAWQKTYDFVKFGKSKII